MAIAVIVEMDVAKAADIAINHKKKKENVVSHSLSFFLIPSNRTTRIASLIPLQGIRQHTGECSDTEVVGSKRTEHQTTTHGKAVQVTGDVHGCHCHFLLGEIITG